MEYLVCGPIFKNVLNFVDGRKIDNIMGATIFSYAGILQFTDNVLLISGKGNDFEDIFGDWFNKNKLLRNGLIEFDNPTILATLQYFSDGTWHNDMEFGPKESEIAYYEAETLRLLDENIDTDSKGIYFIRSAKDVEFYETLCSMKKNDKLKIMSEIITEDCRPEMLETITNSIFKHIDIYSINKPESFRLFSVDSEEKALDIIKSIGKPCYYRVGSKGSYMISGNEAAFVSSVSIKGSTEIDPTGCGNASTAAAVWAIAEGYDLHEIAAIGNVAAAYNVLQYGPYPYFNDEIRKNSLSLAVSLAEDAVHF